MNTVALENAPGPHKEARLELKQAQEAWEAAMEEFTTQGDFLRSLPDWFDFAGANMSIRSKINFVQSTIPNAKKALALLKDYEAPETEFNAIIELLELDTVEIKKHIANINRRYEKFLAAKKKEERGYKWGIGLMIGGTVVVIVSLIGAVVWFAKHG